MDCFRSVSLRLSAFGKRGRTRVKLILRNRGRSYHNAAPPLAGGSWQDHSLLEPNFRGLAVRGEVEFDGFTAGGEQ